MIKLSTNSFENLIIVVSLVALIEYGYWILCKPADRDNATPDLAILLVFLTILLFFLLVNVASTFPFKRIVIPSLKFPSVLIYSLAE